MAGEERERLRGLYEEEPAYWPQADALAAALGLRREDVLTGEDLARQMNALLREMQAEGLEDLSDAWSQPPEGGGGPWRCAAFSPAASRFLLSEDERGEGALLAITGEALVFMMGEARFCVAGPVPLGRFFAETLGLAAAALREEGHSPRLVARIEAWIAAGNVPSFGADLARLTGDAGLAGAAARGDIDALTGGLAAWPGLLDRPREVLRAVGAEHSFEAWLWEHLLRETWRIQRLAGGRPSLRPPLDAGKALLSLFAPRELWRFAERGRSQAQAVLAALDADRRPRAERALARVERGIEADVGEWPTAEVRDLRALLAERVAELARALPHEGKQAVSRILAGILALAEGDAPRALALAREVDPDAAKRQRAALLREARVRLQRLLGMPGEPA